jgi:hypothetical protein
MVLGSVTIIPVDLLNLSSGICGVFSLFSPVAFVLAIDTTVIAEGSGEGIHRGTLFSRTVGNDPGDPRHPLSVGGALCLIVTDTLLYLVLAWWVPEIYSEVHCSLSTFQMHAARLSTLQILRLCLKQTKILSRIEDQAFFDALN